MAAAEREMEEVETISDAAPIGTGVLRSAGLDGEIRTHDLVLPKHACYHCNTSRYGGLSGT